jgi:hypothetical protein
MMRGEFVRAFRLFVLVAAAAAGPLHSLPAPQGPLVDYFVVQYPSISPNGDGIRDSSIVRVGLAGACSTLLLTLEDASGVPLDTLLAAADVPPGAAAAVWRGRDAGGSALPEGAYRLRLAVTRGSLFEEHERAAVVDLTAPLARVERIEPGIYAPGVPGTADTVLIYCSVARYGPGDTLAMTILNPANGAERRSISISGDGLYRAAWGAPPTAADGIYRIALVAADEGGNASADTAAFDVDTKGPDQAFIEPPPTYTNVPPSVIRGRAYDRNGVRGLELVWRGGAPFPPDSVYMARDTLFWRFDVADSLLAGGSYREGRYVLAASCSDMFAGSKHRTRIETTFDLDFTAPTAPALDRPISPAREPSVFVRGTTEWPGTKYVYVSRTAATDTTIRYEPAGAEFAVAMPLRRGTNVIRAIAEDRALNASAPSNAVTVVYEPANTVAWPEAFRGPDAFRVYSAEPALQVTVDIYTVSGSRVASLRENGPAQSFVIEWDLRNDDGEEVRNGPYLAVIAVRYESRTATYKEFVAVVR